MVDPIESDLAHITFPEDYLQISIPLNDRNDQQALEMVNLSFDKVKRMNATSRNWIIVLEDGQEIERIKNNRKQDVDLTDINQIRKIVNLKLMDINYSRETSGLKAQVEKKSEEKKAVPNWRKKSDDSSQVE
jgi:hypothetical protein